MPGNLQIAICSPMDFPKHKIITGATVSMQVNLCFKDVLDLPSLKFEV